MNKLFQLMEKATLLDFNVALFKEVDERPTVVLCHKSWVSDDIVQARPLPKWSGENTEEGWDTICERALTYINYWEVKQNAHRDTK